MRYMNGAGQKLPGTKNPPVCCYPSSVIILLYLSAVSLLLLSF